jgi:23S rRNA (guanosine2251-2'-O)-methyltransferase
VKSSVIFGINAIFAALKSDQTIDKILVSSSSNKNRFYTVLKMARQRQISVQLVPNQALTKKAGSDKHQGIVAIIGNFTFLNLEELIKNSTSANEPPLLAMLDGIEDPHNLGAIIRSAEVAGFTGIVIQQRHSAPLSAVVSKTSAGAMMHLPIAKVVNLSKAIDQLKEKGFWTIGSDDQAAKSYWDMEVDLPLVIIIGSERKGIRRLIKEKCDFVVLIPMYGKTGSLNASVAAGLLFYEIRRKRIYGN